MAAVFAFLHHLAAFTLVASLAVEMVVIGGELTLEAARKLRLADLAYGISAGLLLIAGLARVFHFEKGATYYFHTWTFVAKLALFVTIGLVSIIPTLEFLSWRRSVALGKPPALSARKVRMLRSIVHLELAGVVLILLFAAMMAKGIGLM
jgi:putative membrane protein